MSDQKIGIHFGTTYDGKGSRQLQNGINQAGGAIARLKNSIKSMGSGIGSALKTVGSNLMNIKAGFDMLVGAVSKVGQAIKSAFDMARLENNFRFLIGSADEARKHMQSLYELGRTPPFGTKEFASASKSMMILTNNVLGGKDSLQMLGDVADGVGVPIETMAENIGYLYAMIRDGEPITRATKQLVRMGAISPEVASQMEEMQKAGKPLNEIWNTLTTSLTKFNGSMENTANSAGGKVQEFIGHWEEAKTKIGISIAEIADKHMVKLIDKVNELNNNNSFKEWADDSINWIGKVGSALGSMLGTVYNGAVDFGDTIGTMIGGFSEGGVSGMMKVGKDLLNTQQEIEIAKNRDKLKAKTTEKVEVVNSGNSGNGGNGLSSAQTAKDLAEAQAKEDEKFNKQQLEEIKKVGEKLAVDQQKIADNNRKAVEEELRVKQEVANKERKGYYNNEMESRENLRNTLLTQIRTRLESIHDQQKKQKFYIDASNGGDDGINDWGKGNRPIGPDGNFLRPEHQAEADRDAARGKRNIDSQRIGQNRLKAMQDDYNDLKKKVADNVGGVEGLSDRDREKYNQLKRFFDPEEDKLNKAADQIKKQDLTQINTTLDNIKTMLEQSLNIK